MCLIEKLFYDLVIRNAVFTYLIAMKVCNKKKTQKLHQALADTALLSQLSVGILRIYLTWTSATSRVNY